MTRIIALVLLVLLGVLAVGGALVANAVQELVQAVNSQYQDRYVEVIDEPLPGRADLIDDRRFKKLLRERPDRRAAYFLARARFLSMDRKYETARDAFEEARLESSRGFSTAEELDYIEVLVALQDRRLAETLLADIELDAVPEELRGRALVLLGRLRMSQ